MSSILDPSERIYDVSRAEYGDVIRTNLLGLKDSPVISMDSGDLVGIPRRLLDGRIAKKTTAQTVDNVPVTLPLDVKVVGYDHLQAYGVSAEQQTLMFQNWNKNLTAAERQAYIDQYTAVDLNDSAAVAAFLDLMIAALS
jgi:hypothetical protein